MVLWARLSAVVITASNKFVGNSCLSLSSYCCSLFIVAVVESSVTVVYLRSHQTSAAGFDDLDGLLCVQRRLKFKSGRNETLIFAAVVEPNLLAYSSDSTYRTNVIVRKSFALSSK